MGCRSEAGARLYLRRILQMCLGLVHAPPACDAVEPVAASRRASVVMADRRLHEARGWMLMDRPFTLPAEISESGHVDVSDGFGLECLPFMPLSTAACATKMSVRGPRDHYQRALSVREILSEWLHHIFPMHATASSVAW